jgi:hypothetical protein
VSEKHVKNLAKAKFALSAREVLGHWLVSQIGPAKRVRPSAYPSMFEVSGQTWSMANQALLRVSSIEGYERVKPALRDWVEVNGLIELADMVLVQDFVSRLERSLEDSPIFRNFDPDLENAVLAVCALDCATFARQAKVDTRTVRRWAENGNLRDCWKFKGKIYIPEPELWRFLRERESFKKLEKTSSNAKLSSPKKRHVR